MCDKADKDCENETKEEVKESDRKCKRSLKLLRGNERDLKLDIEIASYEKCGENMAIPTPNQIKVYNCSNPNISELIVNSRELRITNTLCPRMLCICELLHPSIQIYGSLKLNI